MLKLALVLMLSLLARPMFAAHRVTVAELEQRLVGERGKPDAEVAGRLSDLELTERLSGERLGRLLAGSPGGRSTQELRILADQAEFLPLPAAEVPAVPAPSVDEQRRMMGLVVHYVTKAIHQLPNFSAMRVTTSFEETPQVQTGVSATPYAPLHETSTSRASVLYRDGLEVVEARAAEGQRGSAKAEAKGLREWGVFGPILSTVMLDAARNSLSWSHWEQGPNGRLAVFQYVVPAANSHYRVNYCCVWIREQAAPLDRVVGYRGEITVDPERGAILRLTLQASLQAMDPISQADLMVEYGPVDIGGQPYLCATRSVAFSTALFTSRADEAIRRTGAAAPDATQKLLNDVRFEDYHLFRAASRILATAESDLPAAEVPPAASAAALAPADASAGAPVQAATEEAASAVPAAPVVAPAATEAPAAAEDAAALEALPVFRATTREVFVDVVATRNDGEPVPGLGKQDFEIRENGRPQAIAFLQDHAQKSPQPAAPVEMPALLPGMRTNVPLALPSEAVNVLLFDTLNTATPDQDKMRRQILGFFSKMQPGTRMAVFVLGSNLRCIQGITSDSSLLLAALHDPRNGLNGSQSSLLTTRSDRADDANEVATLEAMQTSSYAIDAMRGAMTAAGARDAGARAMMTYQALIYLGHYLAGVPGRKNLIWFAGSFPLAIFPTPEQLAHADRRPGSAASLERVRQSADLFTAAQIAVYPISAEGVTMEHAGEAEAAGPGIGGDIGHTGGQPNSAMSPLQADAGERGGNAEAMERLAASTGGKAFYDTNDLDAALRHAIADGANYYTISYSPTNKTMDGSFRRIEVKLAHGSARLSYRRGYIADEGPGPRKKPVGDPLAPLLQRGLPGATGVLYGLSAERSAKQPGTGEAYAGQNPQLKAPVVRYTVNFVIRSQDLALKPNEQGVPSGKVLLGLKAYDNYGAALNWLGDEESLEIKPEEIASLRKNGVPVHLEIDLPVLAEIHLVTAVYDLNSGAAGTLEIALPNGEQQHTQR